MFLVCLLHTQRCRDVYWSQITEQPTCEIYMFFIFSCSQHLSDCWCLPTHTHTQGQQVVTLSLTGVSLKLHLQQPTTATATLISLASYHRPPSGCGSRVQRLPACSQLQQSPPREEAVAPWRAKIKITWRCQADTSACLSFSALLPLHFSVHFKFLLLTF